MTDTIIEEKPDETAPVETPADVVAPAPSDSQSELDRILAEYTEANPEPAVDNTGAQTDQNFDQLMNELIGPPQAVLDEQAKNRELQGQIDSLRLQQYEKAEIAAFEGFASELQKVCGPNVDEQFARTNLMAMGAERPELVQAFLYRNLTDQDRQNAQREFQQLDVWYTRLKANSNPDQQTLQTIAAIEQRGDQLQFMINGHKMLNETWNEVRTRAGRVAPPIDPGATFDRNMVAQAVREGRGEVNFKEPPVQWGQLGAAEGRRKVKEEFGFDPGWGH